MISDLTHVLSACAVAAILAGCGGSQTASPPTEQLTDHGLALPLGSGYKSIYSFNGGSDGEDPRAALITLDSALYGTTYNGGSANAGTVFAVSAAGKEQVLYSLTEGSPEAGLVAVKEVFFGTSSGDGVSCIGSGVDCGTVFKVLHSKSGWTGKLIYTFSQQSGADGGLPEASLIDLKGMLYGTTSVGGTGGCDDQGCGTVFAVSTAGKQRVIYRFQGSSDGANPEAVLIAVNGTLYGTTPVGGGGGGQACDYEGCGTVFTVSTAGQERVLYPFQGGDDGASPAAGLTFLKGAFYGTTADGGGTGCESETSDGCGTVYSVSTKGQEHVLYRFKGGTDGAHPSAVLLARDGLLYGTTTAGGIGCSNGPGGGGCGTVFAVSSSGEEHTLYRFKGTPDGEYPDAGLTLLGNTLYGTTSAGGKSGSGTVFRISP
jgi:uncharacterized repeat protein (TIGR03803 family)